MIEPIPHLPGHVIGFTASGKVTGTDYENTIIPTVEEALKSHLEPFLILFLKTFLDSQNVSSSYSDDVIQARHSLRHPTMKTILFLITAGAACIIASCAPDQGSGSVPAPKVADLSKIPLARPHPTGEKNMVISPYRPYNIIDVKGHRKGDIAGDPSTAKTDPKTGKIIESTAKYFRIP